MSRARKQYTIIPAAGVSARWGGRPKALAHIEWQGVVQTMLEHCIINTPPLNLCVVGTSNSLSHLMANLVSDHEEFSCEVYDVGNSTRGQADTVGRVLRLLDKDTFKRDSILVINVDNVFRTEDLVSLEKTADMVDAVCSILVHESKDLSCSFVDNVITPRVFLEKPKVRPSPFAMSGAWWFRSAGDLLRAIDALAEMTQDEIYISQALALIPGRKICVPVLSERVVDWGTPVKVIESGARIVDGSETTPTGGVHPERDPQAEEELQDGG